MGDIFGDIQDLDISKLINPKKEEKQSTTEVEVKHSSPGRFNIGPIEEAQEQGENQQNTELPVNQEPTQNQEQEENKTSIIKELSSFLKEKGIIDYTDEEFKDEDDFIPEVVNKAITRGKEDGINLYKESLPEDIKNLINNYESGVPLGQLLETEKRLFEIESITSDKIKESSRLQEEIIEAYMANTGWEQNEIDERIKELQDAGLIEKEALRSHTKLLQLERENKHNMIVEANKKKQEALQKQREQIEDLKKNINSKKEFFDGIPTNEFEKKELFNAITKGDKNGRNEITQLMSDPETYLKVAYFLKIMKGDLSKLKNIVKTEVIKDTKKTLNQPVKQESRFTKADTSIIKNFLTRTK